MPDDPNLLLQRALAAGALEPRLQLPPFVRSFGLVLFVYAVGLSSGPGFVAPLRRRLSMLTSRRI